MSLRLVIEHANHPQQERERTHPAGEFSIGRGAECSWQLEDPDQYVSRKHCVISGGPGRWVVTDASRGGLFIDGGDQPLGPGNSAALQAGMRLRLGDVVIRVEMPDAAAPAPPRRAAPPATPQSFAGDGFFSAPVTPPPAVQRPAGMPEPFDSPRAAMPASLAAARPAVHTAAPPQFDDPFTLDPVSAKPAPPPPPVAAPARPAPLFADPFADPFATPAAPVLPQPAAPGGTFEFGSFFDTPAPAPKPTPKPAPNPAAQPADDWGLPSGSAAPVRDPAAASGGAFDDWGLSSPEPSPPEPEPLTTDADRSRERAAPTPIPPLIADTAPAQPPPPPPGAAVPPPPPAAAAAPPLAMAPEPAPVPDTALIEAFFRGLGMDPNGATDDTMEAMGKRFRMLVEGVMHMLRTRAREKQNVRVAQTIIGSTNVNPLKFMATTDDALAALVTPRGTGYLPPDAAIAAAFRDLADHQVRTWTGMQSALRQMIDRFDPAAIEAEIEAAGLIRSLLAGGRSAKLWQLYNDRYKDIARAAEDRFLGEVGADFRDAYEGNRRKPDDPQT